MCRNCIALFALLFSIEARSAVNVGVVLDTARAASAVIGATGGTLTATAADGTVFTLTIPANALLSSERITMTPVAQANNVPFSGGLVAAVQLEPGGLKLFKLATLTLTTSRPIPPDMEIPMAWHAEGRDLYLYPLVIDPKTVAFKLVHFSGMGVSSGTSAERAAQLARIPCDQESAVQQRLMPIVQQERDREKMDLPPDPAFYGQVEEILTDYYNFTIRPMMAVALQSKDDDILYSAVLRAMSTVRILSFWLAADDPFLKAAIAELYDFMAQALKIVSDNAFNRCVKEHKPEEVLTLMRLERIAQLLGISVDLGSQQKIDQCGSFELVFDSLIEQDFAVGADKWRETIHATSRVPIHFVVNVETTGSAVLAYDYKLTVITAVCSISGARGTDDIFRILDIEVNLNAKQPEDVCKGRRRAVRHSLPGQVEEKEQPKFEIASMTIDPGRPTEAATLVCPNAPPLSMPLSARFLGPFVLFHQSELNGPFAFKIMDWSRGTGSLIARKTYQQELPVGKLTEVTTLDFFHIP